MSTLDPRAGFPSASAFHRIVTCPGSEPWREAIEAWEPVQRDTTDADEGTLLHAHMEVKPATEANSYPDLQPEQRWAVWEAWRQRDNAIAAMGWPEKVDLVSLNERRLWVHVGIRPIYSGQFDETVFPLLTPEQAMAWDQSLFPLDDIDALLLDWKFGRIVVPPAEINLQVLGYAVALRLHYGFRSVTVAVVQPRAPKEERLTMCRYSGEQLIEAYAVLKEAVYRSRDPHAPRHADEHGCRYCPISHVCEVAWDHYTTLPFDLPKPITQTLKEDISVEI